MYNRSILKSVGGSAMGLVRKVLIKNKVEYFKVLFAFAPQITLWVSLRGLG